MIVDRPNQVGVEQVQVLRTLVLHQPLLDQDVQRVPADLEQLARGTRADQAGGALGLGPLPLTPASRSWPQAHACSVVIPRSAAASLANSRSFGNPAPTRPLHTTPRSATTEIPRALAASFKEMGSLMLASAIPSRSRSRHARDPRSSIRRAPRQRPRPSNAGLAGCTSSLRPPSWLPAPEAKCPLSTAREGASSMNPPICQSYLHAPTLRRSG